MCFFYTVLGFAFCFLCLRGSGVFLIRVSWSPAVKMFLLVGFPSKTNKNEALPGRSG